MARINAEAQERVAKIKAASDDILDALQERIDNALRAVNETIKAEADKRERGFAALNEKVTGAAKKPTADKPLKRPWRRAIPAWHLPISPTPNRYRVIEMAADTERPPAFPPKKARSLARMTPEELEIMDPAWATMRIPPEDRDDGDEDETVIVDQARRPRPTRKKTTATRMMEADDEEP